jgi:hypothetical protein
MALRLFGVDRPHQRWDNPRVMAGHRASVKTAAVNRSSSEPQWNAHFDHPLAEVWTITANGGLR